MIVNRQKNFLKKDHNALEKQIYGSTKLDWKMDKKGAWVNPR